MPHAREAAKKEFAISLRKAMAAKGMNQSELARRASEFLPGDRSIGRDLISHYIRGVCLPRGEAQVNALAKALDVKPEKLIRPRLAAPAPASPTAASASPWGMRQLENGKMWLWMNMELPARTAYKIAALLLQPEEVSAAQPPEREGKRNG